MPRSLDPQPPWAALIGLASIALSGCSLLELARGQLALINEQVPLPQAIAQEQDPERRALLREVPEILAFAEEVVGLHAGRSYSGYYHTERRGLTYVITACAQTEFAPYTWWFPIAGEVEYRSYWDEDDAREQADALEHEGYDVWLSPSRAYSSLGILRDPISTTMLRDGLPAFVEVLIHELSHAKLYIPGHTDWNEALASFVGERGAERYFEAARFAHSDLPERVHAHKAGRLDFDQAVAAAYLELEQLYASDRSRAQKLRERQRTFDALTKQISILYPREDPEQWRMNNARLVHYHRYNANNGVLSDLWQASHQNFRRFWQLAEAYARRQFG
jgi:predicted aminopeptidase